MRGLQEEDTNIQEAHGARIDKEKAKATSH